MASKFKAEEKQEAGRDIPELGGVRKRHRRSMWHVLLRPLVIDVRCILAALVVGLVVISAALVTLAFFYTFISIPCIMAMPLLVVSYLVVRLLQLLTNGDTYYKVTQVKAIIRVLTVYCMILLLIPLAFFYLLASTVSNIKHIIICDLPIRHWINVTFMIIGLYTLSSTLSLGVQSLSPQMSWRFERVVNAIQAAAEIVECLMFWWGSTLLVKRVPLFKQHHLLGLPTHQWIKVVIFVIIDIDIIAFCCHLITLSLNEKFLRLVFTLIFKSKRLPWEKGILPWEKGILSIKYDGYWADGLIKNIIFIFGSMVLLLTWNSYFRTHLNETPENKEVVRFGTMALASLLTLAVLWLIKSCILLSWKANHVYVHLKPRLIENLEELYFLGILGLPEFDILSIGDCSPTVDSIEGENKDPSDEEKGFVTTLRNQTQSELSRSLGNEENDGKASPKHNVKKSDHISFMLERFVSSKLHPLLSDKVRDDLHIDELLALVQDRNKVRDDLHNDELPGHFQDRKADRSKICETLHDLQKIAQYFLRAQPTLSSDTYVPLMLRSLTPASEGIENQLSESYSQNMHALSLEKYLEKLIKGNKIHQAKGESANTSKSQQIGIDEWQWFKDLVSDQSKGIIKAENIDKRALKAWLENARGTCMELANTLCSAEEVVNCLDNIISGLLIGATFIMWLLLTGLATTKILVLIASPMLAATFIFGDTCKTLFQGIIFAYACHPFNVGDVVVIDDKMMEVKILGVWKTTFSEIGKTDEVIYPNSELANKKIINYKSDFDWNDRLEFTLKSFPRDKIKKVRTAIKEELSKDGKCSPNHISTEALATADGDMKVVVHLKYNTDNQYGMTLYERLQKKHDFRSEFSVKIQNLLNDQCHELQYHY